MDTIYINDLLHITDKDMGSVKIKFNQFDGYNNPMDEYQRNPDIINNQWLFWRNKQRYFSPGQIAICLLKLSDEMWLLTTIKRVINELDVYQGINYEGEEIEQYRPYFGRVIIKFHKTFMTQGRYYSDVKDELIVNQILPDVFDGDDFPGYDNVRLSYSQLEAIITRGKRDWIASLENQKAVYLITDKSSGKLYVGSATSNCGMLIQRWTSYVNNGHGGNKELIEIVKTKGFDYVKANFQYSILENYNGKVDDNLILKRESWWKETLQSRKWGYNSN